MRFQARNMWLRGFVAVLVFAMVLSNLLILPISTFAEGEEQVSEVASVEQTPALPTEVASAEQSPALPTGGDSDAVGHRSCRQRGRFVGCANARGGVG